MLSTTCFILSVSVLASSAALPDPGVLQPRRGPLLPLQGPEFYLTNDFGWAPDPRESPRWPLQEKDSIIVDGSKSKAFPGINLSITTYNNISCGENPIKNYQFLNGTRKDAHEKDMIADLDYAFNKDPTDDSIDLFLAHTVAIGVEVLQLMNDTLSWLNLGEDIPQGGLLPLPPGVAPLHLPMQAKNPTKKHKRTDDDNSSDISIDVDEDELSDPPEPPIVDPGGVGAPDAESLVEPKEVKRTRKDKVWDGVIIVVGSAFGAAVSYGSLDIGAYSPYVKDHPWLANFFGAAGIAIGIITSIIMGIIQRERSSWVDKANRKARDTFNAGQLAAARRLYDEAKREAKTMRQELRRQASNAASSSSSGLKRRVRKPVHAMKTGAGKAVEAAGETLSRAGDSFGSMKDAIKKVASTGNLDQGSSSSDISTSSAPPDLPSLQNVPEPRMSFEDMQRAVSQPLTRCIIREATPEEEADENAIGTIDTEP